MCATTRGELPETAPLEFWTRGTGADVSAAQAADLAVYALGPDPRQLKQFVNSFSARMALIKQREAQIDGVARLKSSDLAERRVDLAACAHRSGMAADAMELLRHRPRALPTWQEWAFAATNFEREERHLDAGEAADGARADLTILLSDAWSRFSEFLRRADRIPPGISLRPYLTLQADSPRAGHAQSLRPCGRRCSTETGGLPDSLISAAPAAASGYVRMEAEIEQRRRHDPGASIGPERNQSTSRLARLLRSACTVAQPIGRRTTYSLTTYSGKRITRGTQSSGLPLRS